MQDIDRLQRAIFGIFSRKRIIRGVGTVLIFLAAFLSLALIAPEVSADLISPLHQGVLPDADCSSCHAPQAMTLNHVSGGGATPRVCTDCHTVPGLAPTVNAVCIHCHGGDGGTARTGVPYYSTAELTIYATDMHRMKPVPHFSATSDAIVNKKVNFDANDTVCPTAAGSCAYGWTFGDGGNGTGKTASHTYASTSTYMATLRVVANGINTEASLTKPVTPINVYNPPPPPAIHSVAGKVVRLDGSTAVSGAAVRLSQNGVVKYSGASSATGTFSFSSVVDGTYTVQVVKTGLTFTYSGSGVTGSTVVVSTNISNLTATANR